MHTGNTPPFECCYNPQEEIVHDQFEIFPVEFLMQYSMDGYFNIMTANVCLECQDHQLFVEDCVAVCRQSVSARVEFNWCDRIMKLISL